MQPLTTSSGITYNTVSTVSQMHLNMRPLLVSVHAGDYSSADCIVNINIYESMDKISAWLSMASGRSFSLKGLMNSEESTTRKPK